MSVDVTVTVTKCGCNEVRMISKLARHKIDEQVMICFYFTEKLYVCWKEEPFHHHHHHLFLNREGRWGTADDFATGFLHFSLFSTALCDLANSRPVHSLMLSSHLFLCVPCLLLPFTVPCKMVLARSDELVTWLYHWNWRLFTMVRMMVRRSSCGPIACWILTWTSSFVAWSLYEMRSI